MKFVPLVASGLLLILGLLTDLTCKSDSTCFVDSIGQLLFIFGLGLLIVGVFNLVIFSGAAKTVNVFSLIFLSIAVIVVLMTEVECRSMLCVDRELMTLWLSGIYTAIGIGIVVYKKIKERRAGSVVAK